jgi:hypothetical protein
MEARPPSARNADSNQLQRQVAETHVPTRCGQPVKATAFAIERGSPLTVPERRPGDGYQEMG